MARVWTDKEKALLKELWESNVHRNELAKRLGVTGDTAANMARYMGYKRSPRPIKWANVRLEFQIITYRHCGLSYPEIAKKLGQRLARVTNRVTNIRRRAQRRLEDRRSQSNVEHAPRSDRRAIRPCIRCREPFDSSHPGHRICRRCREAADYRETSSVESWMGVY